MQRYIPTKPTSQKKKIKSPQAILPLSRHRAIRHRDPHPLPQSFLLPLRRKPDPRGFFLQHDRDACERAFWIRYGGCLEEILDGDDGMGTHWLLDAGACLLGLWLGIRVRGCMSLVLPRLGRCRCWFGR